MTDFLLNCFVLGDDEDKVFTVEIARDKNVSILKDEIKKKNPHTLDKVDAKDLDLWKVCLPIDDPASKRPRDECPLKVNKRMFSLWESEPSDDDLHILVRAPGKFKAFSYLGSPLNFPRGGSRSRPCANSLSQLPYCG